MIKSAGLTLSVELGESESDISDYELRSLMGTVIAYLKRVGLDPKRTKIRVEKLYDQTTD